MPPPEEHRPLSAEARRFRKIGERERMRGSFIRVVTGTFVGPDGYTFERDMVRHVGAVCIVPLEDDGDTVRCVRQYRAPLETAIIEVPAGKLDIDGEDLVEAARRELAEEVGAAAAQLTELGAFYNSPGFTDERTTCFLAEGLSEVGTSLQGIEELHMTVEPIRLSDLHALVARGRLVDGKTIIALALAAETLRARGGALGEPAGD